MNLLQKLAGPNGRMKHRVFPLSLHFLANPPGYSLFFTFFVLLINMPCTAIQRYNRFRLQTLRKRLIRTGSMLPSMASA